MTDYTELITALREEAEAVKAIEWDIPIFIEDAIEALERRTDGKGT